MPNGDEDTLDERLQFHSYMGVYLKIRGATNRCGLDLFARLSGMGKGRKPSTPGTGGGLGGRIGFDLAPLQKRLKVARLILRKTAHLIEP